MKIRYTEFVCVWNQEEMLTKHVFIKLLNSSALFQCFNFYQTTLSAWPMIWSRASEWWWRYQCVGVGLNKLSIFNIIYMYIQSCVKYLLELFIFVNIEKKSYFSVSIHRANLRNIIIFEKFINLTKFNLFVKKFCSSEICMRMNQ